MINHFKISIPEYVLILPARFLQERDIKQQRKASVQLLQNFDAAYSQMSPDETVNYAERLKIYGEAEAMKWVIQQHPPAAPQQ